MKNTIIGFMLFMFFSVLNVKAQTQGILTYRQIIKDGATPTSRIQNTIIYFTQQKSIEFNVPPSRLNLSQMKMASDSSTNFYIKSSKKGFLYKDFNNNAMWLTDFVRIKELLIKDTLVNFKWEISKEKQIIADYNCLKATTTYRGRTYEAWFTLDVAIKNGPWKFCGLPGLIVKVNDIENIYTFELTGLNTKQDFDLSLIGIPIDYRNDSEITHREFMDQLAKELLAMEKRNRESAFSDQYGSGFTTEKVPPKKEKF